MDEIRVDQVLFGYDNGHKLLCTSLEKPLIQQKDVEILSDASGNGKFDNYISCFPLVEDGYYVFSKTWYAEEMERPGCVWTHMLLIRFEDIQHNMGYINLYTLFCRPNAKNNYNKYRNALFLKREKNVTDFTYYHYVIYTLFYSTKKALIEDAPSKEYELAIIDILTKLPKQILKDLSVCTCSYSNRYVNNAVFSYQVTYTGNAKQLSRDIDNVILYKSKSEIEEYPLWVKYISEIFRDNRQKELYRFCAVYRSYDRVFIREFSKLLYAVKEFRETVNLNDFLELAGKLDLETKIKAKTLGLLFIKDDREINQWFSEASIINQLVLEMQDREGVFVKKNLKVTSIKKQAKRIYDERNHERIYYLFDKYIHQQLNVNGENIIKELILLLEPNDLFDIFDMNRNICSVLISIDSRFLLCKYIWQKDRDYQLEMLNCARDNLVLYSNDILRCIINNTKENISNDVYEIFGNALIDCLYYYCENDLMRNNNQIKTWVPYLILDKEKYVKLVSQMPSADIMFALMSSVDSYSINMYSELEAWIRACEKNIGQIRKNEYFVAVFLLPIVLRYDKTPDKITNLVYEVIYRKLERSELDYEYWKKIDSLLPQVPVEQSWDKCLRLRMAFNR